MSFIKLHRVIIDSQVWSHDGLFKVWIWLLLNANFKSKYALIKTGKGTQSVMVKRGQLLFGRFSAAEALNINESTLYKWLKKLESWDNIKIESNNHYSIITINNYEEYQRENNNQVTAMEQPSNSNVSSMEQQSNTSEESKECIESKEEKIIIKGLESFYELVFDWDKLNLFFENSNEWSSEMCLKHDINLIKLKEHENEFVKEQKLKGKIYQFMHEAVTHFYNWLPKKLKEIAISPQSSGLKHSKVKGW